LANVVCPVAAGRWIKAVQPALVDIDPPQGIFAGVPNWALAECRFCIEKERCFSHKNRSLRNKGRITSGYCRLSLRESACFRGAKGDIVFPAFLSRQDTGTRSGSWAQRMKESANQQSVDSFIRWGNVTASIMPQVAAHRYRRGPTRITLSS